MQASSCRACFAGLLLCLVTGANGSQGQFDFSGPWYNADRHGEGWVLEQLSGSRSVVYWFTYDRHGSQKWFHGVGEMIVEGGGLRVEFPDLYVTRNGVFGPDASTEVTLEHAGSISFSFDSCKSGEVSFSVDGEQATHSVSRLGRLMGTSCKEPGSSLRTYAAQTGSWYDPDDPGKGLVLQWLDRDEALLYWFTYDTVGDYYWMMGVGEYVDGKLYFPEIVTTEGARFGDQFDPDDVSILPWGEVTLTLECSSGRLNYDSILAEFGAGEIVLDRLTHLDAIDCPISMPAKAGLGDAEWDDRFYIAGVTGRLADPPTVAELFESSEGRLLAGGVFSSIAGERVFPLLEAMDETRWQSPLGEGSVAHHAVSAIAEIPGEGVVIAGLGEVRLLTEVGELNLGEYEGFIRRMLWHDGALWAAGSFRLTDEGPEFLAIWNGSVWQSPVGGPPDGPVLALLEDGSSLYVGGQFREVGGVESEAVAKFKAGEWSPMSLESPSSRGARVISLELARGGGIYAVGDLLGALGDSDGSVAHWDGATWTPLGESFWNSQYPGVVSDLEYFQDSLFAIGCFDAIGGPLDEAGSRPARGIARWDGERWESLDAGNEAIGVPWFDTVRCGWEPNPALVSQIEWQRLKSYNGLLYIAGRFSGIAGVPSQSLIAYDGEAFIAQGKTNLGTHGRVSSFALMPPENTLYAYGPLRFGGVRVDSRLARWTGDDWEPVGPALPEGPWRWLDCRLPGLEITQDQRILLGCNRSLSGRPEDMYGQILELVDGNWTELLSPGTLDPIFDISVDHDHQVWVSGGRSVPVGAGYIARLTEDEFTIFEDRFNHVVSKLSFRQPEEESGLVRFVAMGAFTSVGDLEASHLARWDGLQWNPVGDGLSDVPSTVYYDEDIIYVSNAKPKDFDGTNDHFPLVAWDGDGWVNLATPERGFPEMVSVAQFTTIGRAGDRLFMVGQARPAEQSHEAGLHLYVLSNGRFHSLAGGLDAGGSVATMILQDDAIFFGGPITMVDPFGDPQSSFGVARLYWE